MLKTYHTSDTEQSGFSSNVSIVPTPTSARLRFTDQVSGSVQTRCKPGANPVQTRCKPGANPVQGRRVSEGIAGCFPETGQASSFSEKPFLNSRDGLKLGFNPSQIGGKSGSNFSALRKVDVERRGRAGFQPFW